MSRMKKNLALLVILAVVISVFRNVYLKECYQREDISAADEYFREIGIKKIWLDGKARMLVHERFVTEPALSDGDAPDSFSMNLTWPGLTVPEKGYDGETVRLTFLKGVEHPHDFSGVSITDSLSDFLEPQESGLLRLRPGFFDESRNVDIRLSPDKTHYFVKYPEVTATKNRNWRDIHIECDKDGTSGCRAFTELGSRIYGAYSFPDDMFPDKWEEVDKRVTYMIGGFINDPQVMPALTRAEASCARKLRPLRTLRDMLSLD